MQVNKKLRHNIVFNCKSGKPCNNKHQAEANAKRNAARIYEIKYFDYTVMASRREVS